MQDTRRTSGLRWGFTAAPAAAMLSIFALSGPVSAVERADDPVDDAVTFTRDVAPIIQENCQIGRAHV